MYNVLIDEFPLICPDVFLVKEGKKLTLFEVSYQDVQKEGVLETHIFTL